MASASAQNPSGGRIAQTASRPWWKKVLFAQESGLLLVIALMMTALTIYGAANPKPQRERTSLPASAVVENISGGVRVTVEGKATDYLEADGWSVRDVGGSQALFRETQVNRFFEPQNLVLLATNASFIAIMAVAMTAVIVLGGIDLSVGSIYALAAILGAMAMEHSQLGVWAVPMVLVVCCGVGAAAGAFNGTMIVGLRVHPFIITLGTMVVYKGIVFVTTRGQSIGNFPPEMTSGFFKAELFGVNPVPGLLMLLVVTVGALMLSLTVLGRRVYAIGGNETAATYAGIPVGRVKVIVYTLMGAATGLSAAVYLGYYGAAQPSAGDGYELRVIAAAVIGGASLSGGRGSAIGAVLGALVIQLIENAMIILGIDQSYNQIVMGAAIVAAVVLDQAKGRLTGPRR